MISVKTIYDEGHTRRILIAKVKQKQSSVMESWTCRKYLSCKNFQFIETLEVEWKLTEVISKSFFRLLIGKLKKVFYLKRNTFKANDSGLISYSSEQCAIFRWDFIQSLFRTETKK